MGEAFTRPSLRPLDREGDGIEQLGREMRRENAAPCQLSCPRRRASSTPRRLGGVRPSLDTRSRAFAGHDGGEIGWFSLVIAKRASAEAIRTSTAMHRPKRFASIRHRAPLRSSDHLQAHGDDQETVGRI